MEDRQNGTERTVERNGPDRFTPLLGKRSRHATQKERTVFRTFFRRVPYHNASSTIRMCLYIESSSSVFIFKQQKLVDISVNIPLITNLIIVLLQQKTHVCISFVYKYQIMLKGIKMYIECPHLPLLQSKKNIAIIIPDWIKFNPRLAYI